MSASSEYDCLDICSPKRHRRFETRWEKLFSYYAGFTEHFVSRLLISAKASDGTIVLDPWNGSGTTTHVSSTLGITSYGFDINPAMVIIARARLLPSSEVDSLEPVGKQIITLAERHRAPIEVNEPLLRWFSEHTAAHLRALERTTRVLLVGEITVSESRVNLDRMSGFAAAFYAALFAVCRELATPFRSTNPTWYREPRGDEAKISVEPTLVSSRLFSTLQNIAVAVVNHGPLFSAEEGGAKIRVRDSTKPTGLKGLVDLVLTSPPYCTRIDYVAATRLELALLNPLLGTKPDELSRRMLGTTRVPLSEIRASSEWGERCRRFLDELRHHPSKASSGYYLKTHLDYSPCPSRTGSWNVLVSGFA
jgi:hypothetical protein